MTGDSVLGATDLKGCRDRVTEKGEIKCFNVASQHGAVLSVSVLDTAPIRAKMAPVPATFVPVPFFSADASVCPSHLRLLPSPFSSARRSMISLFSCYVSTSRGRIGRTKESDLSHQDHLFTCSKW